MSEQEIKELLRDNDVTIELSVEGEVSASLTLQPRKKLFETKKTRKS